MKNIRKIGFLLLITFAIALGISGLSAIAFAGQPATTASDTMVATPAGPAILPPATISAAPTSATPALPALPTSKDAGSIIIWIFAVLVPWLGWVVSEVMALIPGIKGNGFLHAFLTGCGSVSSENGSGKVTVDINELVAAIKGNGTSSSSNNLAGS